MIEIVSLVKDKKFNVWLKTAGEKVLGELKISARGGSASGGKKSISVVLVNDKKIRELNRQYRKKDKVTDVLSFGDWQSPEFLGEIVIALPQIKRQAKEYGVGVKEELARMLVHGILHLMGLNHEKSKAEAKKMLERQEKLVGKILNI